MTRVLKLLKTDSLTCTCTIIASKFDHRTITQGMIGFPLHRLQHPANILLYIMVFLHILFGCVFFFCLSAYCMTWVYFLKEIVRKIGEWQKKRVSTTKRGTRGKTMYLFTRISYYDLKCVSVRLMDSNWEKERQREIKNTERKIRWRRERKRGRGKKGLGFPCRSLLQSNQGNDAGTGDDTTHICIHNHSHTQQLAHIHCAVQLPQPSPSISQTAHGCSTASLSPLFSFPSGWFPHISLSLILSLLSFPLFLSLCFFYFSFNLSFSLNLLLCFLPFLSLH